VRRVLLILILAGQSMVFTNNETASGQSKTTKTSSSSSRSRTQTTSGANISITGLRLNAPRLVEILNYGYVKELNSDPPKPRQELRLRLYAVPKEGDCVPDTHVVCSRHYYLAVSAFEEGMGEAVYDLGEVGEIDDIHWLQSDEPLTARLKLRASNYPVEYLKTTKNLVKRQKNYELEIRIDKLLVKPMK